MSILIIIGLVVLAYFLIKASQEKKEQKKGERNSITLHLVRTLKNLMKMKRAI